MAVWLEWAEDVAAGGKLASCGVFNPAASRQCRTQNVQRAHEIQRGRLRLSSVRRPPGTST